MSPVVFTVLFVPSFHVFISYFYVSLSLVVVPIVWILTNFVLLESRITKASLLRLLTSSRAPRFSCKESRGDWGRVMVILYVWCVFVCPLQSSTLMRYVQMKRKKQQQRYLHYFKKQKPQTSFYESPRSLRWCGDLRAEERNGNRR